jgi:hypothetical protein
MDILQVNIFYVSVSLLEDAVLKINTVDIITIRTSQVNFRAHSSAVGREVHACSMYEARVRCCSSRDHPRGSEKQKKD